MEACDQSFPLEGFDSDFRSTAQRDYIKHCNPVGTRYNYAQDRVEAPDKIVSRPFKPCDHETFAEYREGAVVPYELYQTPKPILRTDPRKPFVELGELPTTSKEEAIRTRPRIYMVSAIPLDDVKEPDRQLICSYMYTTQGRSAEKEATAYFKRIIPRIDKIETADTVSMKVPTMSPLGEKFVKLGKEWDEDKIRGDTDPTAEFWLNKEDTGAVGLEPFKAIVPESIKTVIKDLVQQEKLSSAHDKKSCITYEGFKPRLPLGIAMEKKKLSTLHPLLSVRESISNRTDEEVAELLKIHNSQYLNASDCKHFTVMN